MYESRSLCIAKPYKESCDCFLCWPTDAVIFQDITNGRCMGAPEEKAFEEGEHEQEGRGGMETVPLPGGWSRFPIQGQLFLITLS